MSQDGWLNVQLRHRRHTTIWEVLVSWEEAGVPRGKVLAAMLPALVKKKTQSVLFAPMGLGGAFQVFMGVWMVSNFFFAWLSDWLEQELADLR